MVVDVQGRSKSPAVGRVDEDKTETDALHTPALVDTGGAVADQNLTATSRADDHNVPEKGGVSTYCWPCTVSLTAQFDIL